MYKTIVLKEVHVSFQKKTKKILLTIDSTLKTTKIQEKQKRVMMKISVNSEVQAKFSQTGLSTCHTQGNFQLPRDSHGFRGPGDHSNSAQNIKK